ncbi:restriction endonuclease subunit S [Staphylococcus hominis]|uniref:restriction endonuclease subunit S n=1 Tax=Staphylococcus hominis TaxID=1290 RepID=UPI002DD61F7C|nr:restriction endonuclease subunit S [Staphylococcus hominis]WRY65793.1 restriction endonuclease subunit S [Staphylococcus hominis]
MNKQTNTPELRFPEFKNVWKNNILKNMATTFSGGTPSSTNKSLYAGEIPFIRSGEINSLITEMKISQKALEKSSAKMVNEGDILYALYGATSGEVAISKIEGAINQAVLCIRTKQITSFLYQYLKLKKSNILNKYLQGGQGNLSAKIIKNIVLSMPDTKEQRKIGDFFSKLDQQIELEEKKLELLEQQKRGYMQKVFSQELRFKDENGKQYPEGDEYKLNEIGVFNSGIGFPESLQGGIEGIPFFKVSDMNTKGNEIVMKKSNNYVSKEIIDSKKWKVITNGPSMIFAKVGAAIMLNRKRLVLEPFLIDNNTMSYSFSNDWDINFGRILFQTIYLPKYAQVGALPSYNAKDIGTIKVKLPIKQEQEKIGSFFNKIDNLIELQTSKIELLKQRKQGLLQKMFV